MPPREKSLASADAFHALFDGTVIVHGYLVPARRIAVEQPGGTLYTYLQIATGVKARPAIEAAYAVLSRAIGYRVGRPPADYEDDTHGFFATGPRGQNIQIYTERSGSLTGEPRQPTKSALNKAIRLAGVLLTIRPLYSAEIIFDDKGRRAEGYLRHTSLMNRLPIILPL